MCLFFRSVLHTRLQPWVCLFSALLWGFWHERRKTNPFVSYRTLPGLDLITLRRRCCRCSGCRFPQRIFGSSSLWSHVLVWKKRKGKKEAFFFWQFWVSEPNFILCFCQRPTWPHLSAVCLATYDGPQTPLRARSTTWSSDRPYVNTQLNHTGR